MKRLDDGYDVIILGSGLGGLVAGAYLSKGHHSVLLLKEGQYDSLYKEKGYRFTPFSNFSEKHIKGDLLKRISRDLDLSLAMSDRQGTRREEGGLKKPGEKAAFQVILPRSRIDLFCRRSMLQVELEREFPKEVDQIKSFYTEMEELQPLLKTEKAKEGARSVFPLRSRSLMRKWWPFDPLPKGRIDQRLAPFSKEFREFIKMQLISWGNLFSDRVPLSLAHYLLFCDGADTGKPEVDFEVLRGKVREKFLQSGGEIEEIEKVDRVEKRWRRGITVSLKEDARAFRSRFLIFNSPLHRLSTLLGNKQRLLSRWGEKIPFRYVVVPLFLGVRERVIPVGMRELLVSISDLNRPYEGGNVLFLSLSQKGDETEAPEGRRALTVESLMAPEDWGSDSLPEHQKGVMEHLYRLIPFLEEHIDFMDWDWARRQYPSWTYPHFFYEAPSDFRWREGVVPLQISKDFFFVGKENFPYLGMEGEVLGGLMIAQHILKRYS
ncbi:MAG: phytoene desaturase family protein [Thermodesulfobacteriota bacterium]